MMGATNLNGTCRTNIPYKYSIPVKTRTAQNVIPQVGIRNDSSHVPDLSQSPPPKKTAEVEQTSPVAVLLGWQRLRTARLRACRRLGSSRPCKKHAPLASWSGPPPRLRHLVRWRFRKKGIPSLLALKRANQDGWNLLSSSRFFLQSLSF